MRFFQSLVVLAASVLAFPKGNAICDGGRRFSCRFCVDACGTPKCGPDPDPADFPVPDTFPDCRWACWCEEGFVWSSFHASCIEGTLEDICYGPLYYKINVIPEYRQTSKGWELLGEHGRGGYSHAGYRKK